MAEEVSISIHKATEVRVAELFAGNAKQCYSFIYYYFFGGGGLFPYWHRFRCIFELQGFSPLFESVLGVLILENPLMETG